MIRLITPKTAQLPSNRTIDSTERLDLSSVTASRERLAAYLMITASQIDRGLRNDLILRRLHHLTNAWHRQLDRAFEAQQTRTA
jgi:hypothetical protein